MRLPILVGATLAVFASVSTVAVFGWIEGLTIVEAYVKICNDVNKEVVVPALAYLYSLPDVPGLIGMSGMFTDTKFSIVKLAMFNGDKAEQPIYVSIAGEVFDTTKEGKYRKDGVLHPLAGKECALALARDSLDERYLDVGISPTSLSSLLATLNATERANLNAWQQLYRDHYSQVGFMTYHQP